MKECSYANDGVKIFLHPRSLHRMCSRNPRYEQPLCYNLPLPFLDVPEHAAEAGRTVIDPRGRGT